ncbi:MAG: LysR substrate-binding domain-containing protein [Pseudomonadota bacterium]
MLAPVFAQFQQAHPDVELRLLSDVQALDLMQRDADVALRPTNSPPEHWIGRELSSLSFATYAHRAYWKAVQFEDPASFHWIVMGDDLNQSPMSKITLRCKHEEAKSTVLNTMMSVFDMVNAGYGMAAMPCYLGEKHETLVRVHDPDSSANWCLWLLAHPDVRRSARVNAFYDFAIKNITGEVLGAP